MSNYNRIFADLSSYQTHFNAHEYKLAGHVLVAIKATEGNYYVNPNHRGYCLNAGGNHIGVVHYHFARPDLGDSPESEADHFLSVALRLSGGRDYLVLDLERATVQGWQHDPEWAHRFDMHVRHHSRFRTILYASKATLEIPGEWFAGDPKRVWDADWSSGPDWAPHGASCAFRQFTDGTFGPEPHSVAGVGRCDVNRMSWPVFRDVIAELP